MTNLQEHTPAITVLLPVYNAERYIREAIDSILSQTFKDFELLIINDGSTDNSVAIIEAFNDPRIQLVHNEQNVGLIETLNRGIELANGEYIARMDADDLSLKNRFELQVEYLNKHPEVGVLGANIEMFGEISGQSDLPQSNEDIQVAMRFENPMTHPTIMMRTVLLKENQVKYKGEFKHNEDWALWFELSKITQFHNLPNVLLKYRIEGQNISEQNKATLEERIKNLFRTFLEDLYPELTEVQVNNHWLISKCKYEYKDIKDCMYTFDLVKKVLINKGYHEEAVSNYLKKQANRLFFAIADQSTRDAKFFMKHMKIKDKAKKRYLLSKLLKR